MVGQATVRGFSRAIPLQLVRVTDASAGSKCDTNYFSFHFIRECRTCIYESGNRVDSNVWSVNVDATVAQGIAIRTSPQTTVADCRTGGPLTRDYEPGWRARRGGHDQRAAGLHDPQRGPHNFTRGETPKAGGEFPSRQSQTQKAEDP
jgi:hypothetical protein